MTVCNVVVVAVEPAAASDGAVELLAGDTVVGAEPATVAGAVALIKFDDVELVVTLLDDEAVTLARRVAVDVGDDDEPDDGVVLLDCVTVEFCR